MNESPAVHRLALGIDPIDASLGRRPHRPLRIELEPADPFLRGPDEPYQRIQTRHAPVFTRHETGRHALLTHPSLEESVDLRIYDRARAYVARRLRVPLPADIDAAVGLRVRRPHVFPGVAWGLPATATGLRSRVLRDGVPVRWARVEARIPLFNPVTARAHADDRGEFVLVLPPAAAEPGELEDPLEIAIRVYGPPEAPTPTGNEGADPLWDLPLETLADPGVDDDDVATGHAIPAGWVALTTDDVVHPFALGRVTSHQSLFSFVTPYFLEPTAVPTTLTPRRDAMPEYLAPGVYVEEVSFRSKSIEGVPTSTTGFVGMTRTGPVYYEEGPKSSEPRLITSFTEFERVYGGLEALRHQGVEHIPYLAHAARAFFNNGGKRLYVSRVFVPINDDPEAPPPLDLGRASRNVPLGGSTGFWRARWPGDAGNVLVETSVRRSRNIAYDDDGAIKVRQVKDGAVVEVIPEGDIENDAIGVRTGNADLIEDQLRVVRIDTEGVQTFAKLDDTDGPPAAGDHVQLIELDVVVRGENGRVEEYGALGTSNSQKRAITRILQKDDPEDEDATLWFDTTGVDASPAQIMYDLQQHGSGRLSGGNDGLVAAPDDLAGEEADPDIVTKKATGLEALAEVDDIAIVAAPDAGALESAGQAADRLIAHAEKMRYRIAVVDAPPGSSMNEIREFRAGFDSTRAALYHPWIEILDPSERAAQGAPPKRLMLPPSGFVTGIYARNDITRGVHKAPANEIVRGLTRFETNINKPRQDVLNPEGINALRFFEGRGHRVWGARTMTSDQEWKYVNVRRLFNFIEHSIDKSTQWAVFEPNGPRLWGNIRRTIEDFLLVLWKQGALLGATAEESFFVRCGRETMTQNDLDNGRLICLIGISPVKPAEFVIFRIGQWTADA